MKAAVLVYPGSNCDRDCRVALETTVGADVTMVWHKEASLPDGLDLIVVPGGFSYGDYLRCGAMAAQSPVTAALIEAAGKGVSVLGVCNGFQILCETGLLPGALLRNKSLHYLCKPVALDVVNTATRFTSGFAATPEAVMTIGHGEGNYFADEETLARIEGEGQVVFRYRDNPNGSRNDIAGIVNAGGNVLGMMPHPDRAYEAALGSADGAVLFRSLAA
jgi:phosphoribosylformylglycinamidine synthase subunit PurQ / glutaminase